MRTAVEWEPPPWHGHAMKARFWKMLVFAVLTGAPLPAGAIPATPRDVKPPPECLREYRLAVKDAALGVQHSVLLLENGKLRCTGYNGDAECEPPAGLTGAVQVVAGDRFSAALDTAGKVTVWGPRPDGRVFVWGIDVEGLCEVPADLQGVVAIAAGIAADSEYCAALLATGRLRVWGNHAAPAVDVPNLVSIFALREGTAGITRDGTVVTISMTTGKATQVPLYGVFDRP